MKKSLLFLASFFVLTVAYGQLNPINNLQFDCTYQMPNNCFELLWNPPNPSLTDTLVGYNIYRDDTLYVFTTSTYISCDPCIGNPDTTYCSFMNFPWIFYIHVTAVYNKSHTESIYNDSAYNYGCGLLIGIKEKTDPITFSISPNPFSRQTTLHTDNPLKNATLTVYNSFGQRVKQIENISGQSITLNRDNLPCGLYILRLTQDNKIFTTDKLIITDN
jgi:hypothetical protein